MEDFWFEARNNMHGSSIAWRQAPSYDVVAAAARGFIALHPSIWLWCSCAVDALVLLSTFHD